MGTILLVLWTLSLLGVQGTLMTSATVMGFTHPVASRPEVVVVGTGVLTFGGPDRWIKAGHHFARLPFMLGSKPSLYQSHVRWSSGIDYTTTDLPTSLVPTWYKVGVAIVAQAGLYYFFDSLMEGDFMVATATAFGWLGQDRDAFGHRDTDQDGRTHITNKWTDVPDSDKKFVLDASTVYEDEILNNEVVHKGARQRVFCHPNGGADFTFDGAALTARHLGFKANLHYLLLEKSEAQRVESEYPLAKVNGCAGKILRETPEGKAKTIRLHRVTVLTTHTSMDDAALVGPTNDDHKLGNLLGAEYVKETKRAPRLKLDKRQTAFMGVVRHHFQKTDDGWIYVSWKGDVKNLGDIVIKLDIDDVLADGSIYIDEALGELMGVGHMGRLLTARGFHSGLHSKGAATVLQNLKQDHGADIVVRCSTKEEFTLKGLDAYFFGHEAVTGKTAYTDVSMTPVLGYTKEVYAKSFLSQLVSRFKAAVVDSMQERNDRYVNASNLALAALHPSPADSQRKKQRKFINRKKKIMGQERMKLSSGLDCSVIAGVNSELNPYMVEESFFDGFSGVRKAANKNRLPIQGAFRGYAIAYDAKYMSYLGVEPSIGQPLVYISDAGNCIVLLHPDDWKNSKEFKPNQISDLTNESGGSDGDDSWIIVFSKSGRMLMIRQPFFALDGRISDSYQFHAEDGTSLEDLCEPEEDWVIDNFERNKKRLIRMCGPSGVRKATEFFNKAQPVREEKAEKKAKYDGIAHDHGHVATPSNRRKTQLLWEAKGSDNWWNKSSVQHTIGTMTDLGLVVQATANYLEGCKKLTKKEERLLQGIRYWQVLMRAHNGTESMIDFEVQGVIPNEHFDLILRSMDWLWNNLTVVPYGLMPRLDKMLHNGVEFSMWRRGEDGGRDARLARTGGEWVDQPYHYPDFKQTPVFSDEELNRIAAIFCNTNKDGVVLDSARRGYGYVDMDGVIRPTRVGMIEVYKLCGYKVVMDASKEAYRDLMQLESSVQMYADQTFIDLSTSVLTEAFGITGRDGYDHMEFDSMITDMWTRMFDDRTYVGMALTLLSAWSEGWQEDAEEKGADLFVTTLDKFMEDLDDKGKSKLLIILNAAAMLNIKATTIKTLRERHERACKKREEAGEEKPVFKLPEEWEKCPEDQVIPFSGAFWHHWSIGKANQVLNEQIKYYDRCSSGMSSIESSRLVDPSVRENMEHGWSIKTKDFKTGQDRWVGITKAITPGGLFKALRTKNGKPFENEWGERRIGTEYLIDGDPINLLTAYGYRNLLTFLKHFRYSASNGTWIRRST